MSKAESALASHAMSDVDCFELSRSSLVRARVLLKGTGCREKAHRGRGRRTARMGMLVCAATMPGAVHQRERCALLT